MFDASTLAAYIVACVALLVVPGPSVLYIVTRSIEGGRAAGIVSALGIATGTVGHVAAAALGLSALLAGSPLVFTIVRLAGAAYLIYLGGRRIATKEPGPGARAAGKLQAADRSSKDVRVDEAGQEADPSSVGAPGEPLPVIYRQAVLVNLLNPKTALFFLAFLPQFVDRAYGRVPLQIAVLGLILIGLGAVSDGTYAVVAGSVGRLLGESRGFAAVKRFGAGSVYLALGVFALLSGA